MTRLGKEGAQLSFGDVIALGSSGSVIGHTKHFSDATGGAFLAAPDARTTLTFGQLTAVVTLRRIKARAINRLAHGQISAAIVGGGLEFAQFGVGLGSTGVLDLVFLAALALELPVAAPGGGGETVELDRGGADAEGVDGGLVGGLGAQGSGGEDEEKLHVEAAGMSR
jgi:hypothetical protein